MARPRVSVDFTGLNVSVDDYLKVRGQELHVIKNPGDFTKAQVAAADALARGSWTDVGKLYNAAEAEERRPQS